MEDKTDDLPVLLRKASYSKFTEGRTKTIDATCIGTCRLLADFSTFGPGWNAQDTRIRIRPEKGFGMLSTVY